MANDTFLGYDDEGNSQYGYVSGNSIYVNSVYPPGEGPPSAYGPFVQGAQSPAPAPTEMLNLTAAAPAPIAPMPGLQVTGPGYSPAPALPVLTQDATPIAYSGGLSAVSQPPAVPVTSASAYGPYVPGAAPPTQVTSAPSINVSAAPPPEPYSGVQSIPSDFIQEPVFVPKTFAQHAPVAGGTTPVGGLGATTAPSTTATPAAAVPPPTTTTAGTSIFGPSATVVGDTMYTSDGRIINNPIVSDYQQYGLTAPKGTPTVSPKANAFTFGQPTTGARSESLYTGATAPVGTDPFSQLYGQQTTNPYAAFNAGQDITQPYVTASGDLILPGGRIVRNPTIDDYKQYGITANKELGKGSFTKEEQSVYNQIINTGNSAANILYQSAIANGIDKNTANKMADSVRNDYKQQATDYRGSAYLPGVSQYQNFYTKTAEEFLGDIPEEQRSFRPTAEQIFNSLSPEQKANQSVENVQTWLNNNPDYKVQFTPQMIQQMANNGAINLGTKLVGVNYDSLAKDDPTHLKAINEATNKFNLGLNLMNDWGLFQNSKNGKTSTGVSVQMASAIAQGLADGIVSPEDIKSMMPNLSSKGVAEWTEFANDMAKLRGDKDITTADLREIAKGHSAPKLAPGTDDTYIVTTSGSKKGGQYIILKKTGDDSYQIRGGTSSFTPTGGNFWSKYLPVIAGAALAFVPGMQGFATGIGSALGAGETFAPIVGGAVLGAGKSAILGGDPLMGALTGGAGAAASGLVNSALSPNAWHAPMIAPDAFSLTNPQVIGGLSQTAGNVASNLVSGNPIMPGLASGLINTGVNASFPAISNSIQSALPAGTPSILGKSITGGLIGSGVGALTGMDPLASGAMGAAAPLINYGVQQAGLTGVPANMIGGGLGLAARASLQNQAPLLGAAAGVLAPIVSYGFDQFGHYVGFDKFGRPVNRT